MTGLKQTDNVSFPIFSIQGSHFPFKRYHPVKPPTSASTFSILRSRSSKDRVEGEGLILCGHSLGGAVCARAAQKALKQRPPLPVTLGWWLVVFVFVLMLYMCLIPETLNRGRFFGEWEVLKSLQSSTQPPNR